MTATRTQRVVTLFVSSNEVKRQVALLSKVERYEANINLSVGYLKEAIVIG